MTNTFPATTYSLFGSSGSTWGTTDNGQEWDSDTASYWSRGTDDSGDPNTYARLTVDPDTFPTYDHAYIDLSSEGVGDQGIAEVLMLMKWSSTESTNPQTDGGPMLARRVDNHFYFLRIRDNLNQVTVSAYDNGTLRDLESASRTLTPDTWYWVRFQKSSTGKLKCKMWAKDTTEPSSWLIQVNTLPTSSLFPFAGDWGFVARKTAHLHKYFVRAFYAYTLSDDDGSHPSTDNFTRTVTEGLGVNAQGQAWEGNVGVDPNVALLSGNAITANGFASVTTNDDVDRFGALGPDRSSDSETLMRVHFNSTAGTTQFFVGLRGNWDTLNRGVRYTGYAVRALTGGTTLTLWKKTTLGGAWTSITATPTAHTALNNTDTYWIRFQIIGTTLRARLWRQGDAEPGTWNVTATDASIGGSGAGYFVLTQDAGITATRTARLYSFTHGAPTYAGTTHTVVGALTNTVATDTTLTVRQAFTQDSNANNAIVVQYRKASESTWTTWGGTPTRTSSYFEAALTGLTSNMGYYFRMTITDTDGVSGNVPNEGLFFTTLDSILTGSVEITASTPTTLDVTAHYFDDPNDNSTASLAYRTSGANVNIVNDGFNGETGGLLQNHFPEVGDGWVVHPNSAATRDVKLWQGRIYAATSLAEEKVIYYNETVPASVEYDVKVQMYIAARNFNTGVVGRCSTSNGNYYLARYNTELGRFELIRGNSGGADTLLGSYEIALETERVYDIILRLRDSHKSVYLEGSEIIRSTDNTHTAVGRAGVYFLSPTATVPEGGFITAEDYEIVGTQYNQILLDDFIVDYRISGSSYTVAGAMTANRGLKEFTRQLTGLTADTVYEVRVTFSDVNGINGMNPLYLTASTNGQTVELTDIIPSPQSTSASIEAVYLYDTNNNSSVKFQYRKTSELLWTTVPASKTLVNRTLKRFYTTLVALKPSTTYEVKAIMSDPNGLLDGSPASLTELFTTYVNALEEELQSKNFLFKVYSPAGDYITTWHDAPAPEYAWHENGGVSDLRVTLNRPLSVLQTAESGIDFQNRVDIWTLDPSSDGFGPNMLLDSDFELGSWTLGSNASISSQGGPDDSNALLIDSLSSAVIHETQSEFIPLFHEGSSFDNLPHTVPLVLCAVAKSRGEKVQIFIRAYDIDEEPIDMSDEIGETVGTDWQTLRIEYRPPAEAYYVRVCAANTGEGFSYIDKVSLLAKEALVYRGRIETFEPKIDQSGESINIEILGLVSLLSDDYIDFMQFVQTQPEKDVVMGRFNHGKTDPATMMQMIIEKARKQNPACALYYDDTSIQPTNIPQGFTFREQQLRACFDKIRQLCPAGWHYYVEPDGRVILRGPETAATHKLRIGVEVMNFSVQRSIRNLKNYIHVKGRQDDDESELDGEGSIHYIAFDQESIDKYGKRVMFLRDAQITDKNTAQVVGDGRLEEYNREEQRAQCLIPDEKSIIYTGGALKGYNIEAFRPGDNIVLFDPVAGPRNTYWDQFLWDNQSWDVHYVYASLPDMVPIKTIQVSANEVRLELSERQPSGTGDFGRLLRWMQLNEADDN